MKLTSTPIFAAALGWATALAAPACVPSDGTVDSYLLVSPAARQPASTALGTIVVLQQRGGAFLRVRAQGGAYWLPGDAAGGSGRTSSCTAAPKDDALYFLDVLPASAECLLSVDLLASPASGADCSGTLVDTKLVPVTTTRANPTTTTSTATGTGGAGTSSSSGITGGAGGKSGTGGAGGKGGG